MSDGADRYVDVREIHPDYERRSCWNCDNTWLARRTARGTKACHHCFMGQEQVGHPDESHDHIRAGYIDYRLLWYGDVSVEEARERFVRAEDEIDDVLDAAYDREVRL